MIIFTGFIEDFSEMNKLKSFQSAPACSGRYGTGGAASGPLAGLFYGLGVRSDDQT